MTWKKTKIREYLRTQSLDETTLMRPYRKRNFRVQKPPGWVQMCKAVGLRPDGPRGAAAYLYGKGRGRKWRINASGTFDMSCPYADFARWANSTARTFPLPKTKTELELYVRFAHT